MTDKQKINEERRKIASEFHQRCLVYYKAKRALALRFYDIEPNFVKVASAFHCSSEYARQMVWKAEREQHDQAANTETS